MINHLKIGDLYRWEPKNWKPNDEERSYCFYQNNPNDSQSANFMNEDLTRNDIFVILQHESHRNYSTYQILTTKGVIGWINIENIYLDHWFQVSKLL